MESMPSMDLSKFTCLLCSLILWFVLFSLTYHHSDLFTWDEFAVGLAQSSTFVASCRIWFHCCFFFCSGKRKALKLNFANPPIKPTARFTLNTAGPPFQNPHMWVNPRAFLRSWCKSCKISAGLKHFDVLPVSLYLNTQTLLVSGRERLRTHSIESSGKLKISAEQHWDFTAEDLKDLGEIGRGAYGSVNKMVHKPSNQIMAVKVIYLGHVDIQMQINNS